MFKLAETFFGIRIRLIELLDFGPFVDGLFGSVVFLDRAGVLFLCIIVGVGETIDETTPVR